MKGWVCATALVLAAVTAVQGGELAGVQFPDAIQVAGRTLQLNGMGLRTWLFFHVYVAGLYVEHSSRSAQAILAADESKQIRLAMLRGLDRSKIANAIEEGFEKNSKAQIGQLRDRLARLRSMFPDVGAGEQIELTYVPGAGTTVTAQGAIRGVIEGMDFADALFAVWLGADPVQQGLKADLLRGGSGP